MLLSIDEKDKRPIYLQIIIQVKEQVRRGTLKPGDELPSVRELADSLGVNMHTVRGAYLKLRDEGLINLRLGRRATVAQRPVSDDAAARRGELEARLEELITDALLAGLSPEELRKLVDGHLGELK